MSSPQTQPITLLQLNRLIASKVTTPDTANIWVSAELSDVSMRGGHCYFELVEKDERGMPAARARGVIWANNAVRLIPQFEQATGQRFASSIKVLVRASVSMHAVYGLSLVISDIDPSYTLGDLERRRMEILARLKEEGVIDNNRTLTWPDIPTRIAVISAPAAAGYGDFINQLFTNPSNIRFDVKLFSAIMQGERAPDSIIAALDAINAEADNWDCVVIIRGGGATSDLQAYEDYDLAANVANFPLPIIIGIGHERDRSVLDWVANMRVKTPTAAAEWLIARAESLLNLLHSLASRILQTVTERVSGARQQLSHYSGQLPVVPKGCIDRAQSRLNNAASMLSNLSARRILPQLERLNLIKGTLSQSAMQAVSRNVQTLDSMAKLLDALSPNAVLRRGYTITRDSEGRIIQSAKQVKKGDSIMTITVDGQFTSTAT